MNSPVLSIRFGEETVLLCDYTKHSYNRRTQGGAGQQKSKNKKISSLS